MKQHLIGLIVGFVTLAFSLMVVSVGRLYPAPTVEESPALSEYEVGRLEAERDLRESRKIYRRCERNCVWTELTDEFENIMLRDYGVTVVPVDSCSVDGPSRERTDGYNEVQVAELEEAYGEGVIERAQGQALDEFHAQWERRR